MAGWRASTRWTGAALLVSGILAAARLAIPFLGSLIGRIVTLGGGAFIGALWVLGAAVAFVVRFWVYELGKDGPGARLLWYAAVCGGLALLPGPILFLIPSLPDSALRWVLPATNYASFGLYVAVTGLFAVGLLRSGLVPAWAAKLGMVAAIAGVSLVVPSSVFGDALRVVRSSAGGLDAVFTVAIGASLMRRPEDEGRRAPRSWAVALVVASSILVALAVGYIAALAQARNVEAMTPTSPFPPVFETLFPGFTNATEFDEFLPGDDLESTVSTFELRRSGDTFMPVDFSNSGNVSGEDGRSHGKVISVDVPGHGRWYLADNYFVDNVDSQYASVPRSEKLSLWDAFVAAHPAAVRILGVFPIDRVADVSLLKQDGYSAADLARSTLVVYTPETESAIAEELSWSTPDELIVNGRAYEADFSNGKGDTVNRLYVGAFTWDGSKWRPANRSAAVGKP